MKYLQLVIILVLSPLFSFAQVQKTDTVLSKPKPRLPIEEVSAMKIGDSILLKKVTVHGNRQTRASVILREMSIEPGEYYISDGAGELLELNRKRIFNLSIFTEVILIIDTLAPSVAEWHIYVKEQWFIIPEFNFQLADRNFNVWWVEQNHDIRRANIGVSLKHRNFRGNLEQLSVTAQIGYTQKFGIEYYRPYIDKSQRHGIGVSAFVAQNEEKFYITDSNKYRFIRTPSNYVIRNIEASVLYTFRPEYATKHIFELRYKDYQVDDTLINLNPAYFLNGSTEAQLIEFLYRFDLNMVDNWNYPMVGFKTVFHAVARVGWKGFDFQNYYMVESGYFRRFSKKWYTSTILRGRLSFPNYQPYAFRYAMGLGSEYVRGYEYYVVDGSHYGLLRNNLKYELLNTSLRFIPIRFLSVLPIRIYPKVFVDVGYTRNQFPGNSFLNNRGLYSGGVGVDMVSVYDFKLRLEYAWNHLGQNGLFLHLSSE